MEMVKMEVRDKIVSGSDFIGQRKGIRSRKSKAYDSTG